MTLERVTDVVGSQLGEGPLWTEPRTHSQKIHPANRAASVRAADSRQEPVSRYLAYFRPRGMAVGILPVHPSSGYGCWTSLGSTTSSRRTEFQGFVGHRAAVPAIDPEVVHQADPTPLLHITPPDDHHWRHPGPSCTSPTGLGDAKARQQR